MVQKTTKLCQPDFQAPRIYIKEDKCTGCGQCAEVCPFGLPVRNEIGVYEISDVASCVECSACKRNCPAGAIIMQEQEGCGCLWDVVARKKGKSSSGSCC